ncbi:hypothetical protein OAT18_03190 [Tenacibaculum sp.]|nr:hypothetical protein [Tenacibaculum sp.]
MNTEVNNVINTTILNETNGQYLGVNEFNEQMKDIIPSERYQNYSYLLNSLYAKLLEEQICISGSLLNVLRKDSNSKGNLKKLSNLLDVFFEETPKKTGPLYNNLKKVMSQLHENLIELSRRTIVKLKDKFIQEKKIEFLEIINKDSLDINGLEVILKKLENENENSIREEIHLLIDISKVKLSDNYEDIKKLKTPFRIIQVYTTYNLMSVNFDLEPLYNDMFLHNNDTRKSMITKGSVFWYENDKLCYLLAGKSSQLEIDKLKDKIKTSYTIYNNVQWWRGCHAELPENCKVILSFDNIYPTLYVKKYNSNDEIFLEEQAWSMNMIYNKSLVNQSKSNFEDSTPNEIGSKGKSSLPSQISFPIKTSGASFQDILVDVNAAAKDCDIIAVMPYTPSKADLLLRLSFNKTDSDTTVDEIILTTS